MLPAGTFIIPTHPHVFQQQNTLAFISPFSYKCVQTAQYVHKIQTNSFY